MAQITVDIGEAGRNCPYCRFPLKAGIVGQKCDGCGTTHHQECWDDGSGCAVFGCPENKVTTGPPRPTAPVAAAGGVIPPVTRTTPTQVGATQSKPWPDSITYRTGVLISGTPLELWIVIGLFTIAGIYLLQASLRLLPDLFNLFQYDSAFYFVLVVLVFLVAALGVGFLWLARELHRGSRVARGLAYVIVGCLVTLVLFGNGASAGYVLVMLGGLASAAILALSPAVQEVFTSSHDAELPSSLIIARVSLAVATILFAIDAILNFCLASLGGKYVAIGLLELAIAAVGFVLFKRLRNPDKQARTLVTAGAVVAFILLLFGRHDLGFAMVIGLVAAVPICLWLPPDIRAFYGDGPITATRQT